MISSDDNNRASGYFRYFHLVLTLSASPYPAIFLPPFQSPPSLQTSPRSSFLLCRQVMTNCDELFEREELSAAPDIGWPDCFNSGVFVFSPSRDTFSALVQLAAETGSFDGELAENRGRWRSTEAGVCSLGS